MIQAITLKVQVENMGGTKWIPDFLLRFTAPLLYQKKGGL